MASVFAISAKSYNIAKNIIAGRIPLNIHEVTPRPKRRESYGQKKTPVDQFIGHIPLLYKKAIKDQIQQCRFEHFMPKAGENLLIFRSSPLIKDIYLFAWRLPGFPSY